MHADPAQLAAIRAEFRRLTNLTAGELSAFLDTPESHKVGTTRRGEAESVGRQSARRILAILTTPDDGLTEADHDHMRKVVAFRRRHLAQRPFGDVSRSRWRWSLMNWGHDPTRPPRGPTPQNQAS